MNKYIFTNLLILLIVPFILSQDYLEEEDGICYLTGAKPIKVYYHL
jgi:hypothetical protein